MNADIATAAIGSPMSRNSTAATTKNNENPERRTLCLSNSTGPSRQFRISGRPSVRYPMTRLTTPSAPRSAAETHPPRSCSYRREDHRSDADAGELVHVHCSVPPGDQELPTSRTAIQGSSGSADGLAPRAPPSRNPRKAEPVNPPRGRTITVCQTSGVPCMFSGPKYDPD